MITFVRIQVRKPLRKWHQSVYGSKNTFRAMVLKMRFYYKMLFPLPFPCKRNHARLSYTRFLPFPYLCKWNQPIGNFNGFQHKKIKPKEKKSQNSIHIWNYSHIVYVHTHKLSQNTETAWRIKQYETIKREPEPTDLSTKIPWSVVGGMKLKLNW